MPFIRHLLSAPIVIGLQIRTGDAAFLNGKGEYADDPNIIETFVKCAQDIMHFNPGAKWLVVSDSNLVRRSFVNRFPHAFSAINITIGHTLDERVRNAPGLSNFNATAAAVAEQWLFATIPSYFVVSRYSGYGRLAAAQSLRWGHVYTVDNRKPHPRTCHLNQDDAYHTFARHEPGI